MNLNELLQNLKTCRSWTKNAPHAQIEFKLGDTLIPLASISSIQYKHGKPDKIVVTCEQSTALTCGAYCDRELTDREINENNGMCENCVPLSEAEKIQAADVLVEMVREHEAPQEIEQYDESITIGVIVNIALIARFAANAPMSPGVIDALRELAKSDDVAMLTETISGLRRAYEHRRVRVA